MLNITHKYVVVGRRPGLTSRRWANDLSDVVAIVTEMEQRGHYSVVNVKRNPYFKA